LVPPGGFKFLQGEFRKHFDTSIIEDEKQLWLCGSQLFLDIFGVHTKIDSGILYFWTASTDCGRMNYHSQILLRHSRAEMQVAYSDKLALNSQGQFFVHSISF
jgi:hypothetical protein